jgi:hypothetical protein
MDLSWARSFWRSASSRCSATRWTARARKRWRCSTGRRPARLAVAGPSPGPTSGRRACSTGRRDARLGQPAAPRRRDRHGEPSRPARRRGGGRATCSARPISTARCSARWSRFERLPRLGASPAARRARARTGRPDRPPRRRRRRRGAARVRRSGPGRARPAHLGMPATAATELSSTGDSPGCSSRARRRGTRWSTPWPARQTPRSARRLRRA